MPKTIDYFETAVALADGLEKRGLIPVLVGGMALVILGSQRITRDFDFLMSSQASAMADLVDVFYKNGFELVTKFNKDGGVQRTVDNARIAAIKLRSDLPDSLFFYHWEIRLKVDILLDFPLPAQDIARRATKIKIKSRLLRIASIEDLIRMKELAYADRHSAADATDLEFLKNLQSRQK